MAALARYPNAGFDMPLATSDENSPSAAAPSRLEPEAAYLALSRQRLKSRGVLQPQSSTSSLANAAPAAAALPSKPLVSQVSRVLARSAGLMSPPLAGLKVLAESRVSKQGAALPPRRKMMAVDLDDVPLLPHLGQTGKETAAPAADCRPATTEEEGGRRRKMLGAALALGRRDATLLFDDDEDEEEAAETEGEGAKGGGIIGGVKEELFGRLARVERQLEVEEEQEEQEEQKMETMKQETTATEAEAAAPDSPLDPEFDSDTIGETEAEADAAPPSPSSSSDHQSPNSSLDVSFANSTVLRAHIYGLRDPDTGAALSPSSPSSSSASPSAAFASPLSPSASVASPSRPTSPPLFSPVSRPSSPSPQLSPYSQLIARALQGSRRTPSPVNTQSPNLAASNRASTPPLASPSSFFGPEVTSILAEAFTSTSPSSSAPPSSAATARRASSRSVTFDEGAKAFDGREAGQGPQRGWKGEERRSAAWFGAAAAAAAAVAMAAFLYKLYFNAA